MTDKSIKQELSELKQQLDELKSDREAAQIADSEAMTEDMATDQTADEVPVQEESGTHDLAEQLQELFENLNDRLEETNPTTVLAIFALGVLLGRTLSR